MLRTLGTILKWVDPAAGARSPCVLLAVANDQSVTVHLNPFDTDRPGAAASSSRSIRSPSSSSCSARWSAALIAWSGQRKYRRRARERREEAALWQARAERSERRAGGSAAAFAGSGLPAAPRARLSRRVDMRVISAEDLAAIFTFPRPDRGAAERLPARRRRAGPPSPYDRAVRRAGGDAAPHAGLGRPAGRRADGGYLGVKIVSVYPGNAARGKPSVSGTYLLMDGDDRRAARRHRRPGADALADGRRLGARRLLSRARGCEPARHGRRRRARALSDRGACERPADRRGADLEPQRRERAERLAASFAGRPYAVRADDRSRSGGARRRHRLLRHALRRAAGARRLAEARRASRSGRRLHAGDARERRRGGAPRARSMSTRATAR